MARNTGTAVGYSYRNITGQATTVVSTGTGILHAITINAPTATGTITLYDNTAASGSIIGTITVPASPVPVTLFYDAAYTTGLTVVTSVASSNITVLYI